MRITQSCDLFSSIDSAQSSAGLGNHWHSEQLVYLVLNCAYVALMTEIHISQDMSSTEPPVQANSDRLTACAWLCRRRRKLTVSQRWAVGDAVI